jgi:hypothetical protein
MVRVSHSDIGFSHFIFKFYPSILPQGGAGVGESFMTMLNSMDESHEELT